VSRTATFDFLATSCVASAAAGPGPMGSGSALPGSPGRAGCQGKGDDMSGQRWTLALAIGWGFPVRGAVCTGRICLWLMMTGKTGSVLRDRKGWGDEKTTAARWKKMVRQESEGGNDEKNGVVQLAFFAGIKNGLALSFPKTSMHRDLQTPRS